VRVISVHVPDEPYKELKLLAATRGVPVAALIRTAMTSFLERERPEAGSVLDLPPLDGGRQLRAFRREQLLDEMVRWPAAPYAKRKAAASKR
jgi:hypothetical protein